LPQTHWGSLHRSPDPLAGLGVGPTGNGKEGGEEKRREGRGKGGKGGEGVPECPNPELASLYVKLTYCLFVCLSVCVCVDCIC